MANSRLERLGTIFTRVTSLMKCGAMSSKDKPLWYEIYQAFPPIDEPSFARRVPIKEVKPILYPEDRIRAKFHRGNYVSWIKVENLEGGVTTSDVTQKVISVTAELLKEEPNLNEDQAITKAVEKLMADKAFAPEKPRSMFKPVHRKTSDITASVDMVNFPKQVDSSQLKNIAQKDVNVSSNLSNQLENDDGIDYQRNSVARDFKNAFKNASNEKLSPDDDSEKKY